MTLDSVAKLRARARRATDKDQVAGFLFQGIHACAERELGKTAAEALRVTSKVPKRPMGLLKYAAAPLLEQMALLAEALQQRGRATEDAFALIGDDGTRAFLDSAVGQMLRKLSGDSPHRILSHAPLGFGSVYSFGRYTSEKVSEQSWRVTYDGDLFGPAIQAGVARVGLSAACGLAVQVEVERCDKMGMSFAFRVSWQPTR